MTKKEIYYSDVESLREVLVGRTIVSAKESGSAQLYNKRIAYKLDDGSKLVALARDGGCACANGCFSVDTVPNDIIGMTILNVEVQEEAYHYDDYENGYDQRYKPIEPGSVRDGSSKINIFLYGELDKTAPLVTSEGGDNGYYGWGFWLEFKPAKKGE